MGIRFFCENCRQLLNVKTYQAGEEGVCPKCEHPIRVPEHSTAPSKSQLVAEKRRQAELRARQQALEEEQKTNSQSCQPRHLDGLEPGQSPAERSKELSAIARQAMLTEIPANSGDMSGQGNFLLDKPANPWLQPNSPDPIETGLKKIWYVRYPKAGEEGPIKGKRIAKMLKEKKIHAGCFVWREDWEDWIRAELLFRELQPAESATPDSRLFTDANASIPRSYQKKAHALANAKKRRLALGVVAIVAGMVTIGFLVWLLTTLW